MKFERMRCPLEVKFAPPEDTTKVGSFTGYASVFDIIDHGGDLIAPGAFKTTLRDWGKRGKLPKMLLMHGGMFGPAEDSIPIGQYTKMIEDEKGLYVEGQLFGLTTDKGVFIHEGMKSGELDALSIGYEAIDVAYGKKPEEPRRTLKKVNLFEVSVVTFGMNQSALIDSAKAYAFKAVDSDLGRAIRSLGKAIKIHAGHMDGSINTDEASQQEMMDLMEGAHSALTDKKPMEDDMKSIEFLKSLAGAETYLRDVAGFSQRQAVAFVSRIKGLRPSDSEGQQIEAALAASKTALSLIRRR